MLESLLLSLSLLGGTVSEIGYYPYPFSDSEVCSITEKFEEPEAVSEGDGFYGNAKNYESVSSKTRNCFGYAIDVNEWIRISFFQACTLIDDMRYYNRVVPAVIQEAGARGVSLRYLNNLSDTINKNERRIAFRVARDSGNNFIDYHFRKQHSDGSWSHKLGAYDSFQFNVSYKNTPEYDSAWYYSDNGFTMFYNTPTTYFAVVS